MTARHIIPRKISLNFTYIHITHAVQQMLFNELLPEIHKTHANLSHHQLLRGCGNGVARHGLEPSPSLNPCTKLRNGFVSVCHNACPRAGVCDAVRGRTALPSPAPSSSSSSASRARLRDPEVSMVSTGGATGVSATTRFSAAGRASDGGGRGEPEGGGGAALFSAADAGSTGGDLRVITVRQRHRDGAMAQCTHLEHVCACASQLAVAYDVAVSSAIQVLHDVQNTSCGRISPVRGSFSRAVFPSDSAAVRAVLDSPGTL